ncbi:zinc ion binding / nucleic acid binding protein [Thalictrum thalictroides]|uniref:Zinc ion binding / nucleic acid binding protein n=1 Tax=Thalictrum thalictroides TaxID=46969 RepID=A0A7J6W414_THATH|nr:zinc ion binding / nucleic acid binding protein [Thalictrum thalictroides]
MPPSAGSTNLEYFEPVYKDGFLQIPEEVREEGARLWEDRVVGFFLDKKLPFNYVKTAVTNKWKTSGEFEMALDSDLFYFKFSNLEDKEKVIEEGSFHLAGKLFIIRPWSREVEESRGMIKSVPVWVKLSQVPKDMWSPKGFSFLASAIGKPLFIDKTTEKATMLSFARVCVEVEPNKELPIKIPLDEKRSQVAVTKPAAQTKLNPAPVSDPSSINKFVVLNSVDEETTNSTEQVITVTEEVHSDAIAKELISNNEPDTELNPSDEAILEDGTAHKLKLKEKETETSSNYSQESEGVLTRTAKKKVHQSIPITEPPERGGRGRGRGKPSTC